MTIVTMMTMRRRIMMMATMRHDPDRVSDGPDRISNGFGF
jgi:hypothetical protein